MKIIFKLLFAAIAYLAIILFIGKTSHERQINLASVSRQEMSNLGDLAANIYDKAFTGVDYAHKAEKNLLDLRVLAEKPNQSEYEKEKTRIIKEFLDNLDVSIERAMTDKSRETAKAFKAEVENAGLNTALLSDEVLGNLNKDMDKLVKRYANDAFRYRSDIDDLLDKNQKYFDNEQTKNEKTLYSTLIGASVFALIVTLILAKAIVPHLKIAVKIANSIANGNLDNDIKTNKGRSETAQLLNSLAIMQSAIKDNKNKFLLNKIMIFEGQVSSLLKEVGDSIAIINNSAESIANDMDITNSNIQNTISATAEASDNVSAIAAAAEELSVSVNEISSQVSRSAEFSQDAVRKTNSADVIIQDLADSAKKINQVIKLIENITNNINLLALNATIEAARAGDAGKGFSVVASEVKSLANQTAQSTESISSQINGIRTVVDSVIAELTKIRTLINEIGTISTSISAAVEEQGFSTNEIARNIQSTSAKVNDISKNISEVGKMSNSTSINSRQSLESVKSFTEQSKKLNEIIRNFLKEIAV